MTNKEVFEINDKLLAYIKGLNLINPRKLTLDTLIERDLGITGDDAIDFIEEFAQEFNVDITSFDYSKYFRGEGVNIFDVISRLLFREKHVIHADMPLRKLADVIKIRIIDKEENRIVFLLFYFPTSHAIVRTVLLLFLKQNWKIVLQNCNM